MLALLAGLLGVLAQDQTLDEKVERFRKLYLDSAARRAFGDGERLKGNGKFDEAIVRYQAALKIMPDYPAAAYQLAATYGESKRPKEGIVWLARAVELGFWGYETMTEDEDLESLRKLPEYAALEAKVKAKYALEAPKHPGGSLLEKPEGAPPAAGWPVVLLLHGYGSNKEDFGNVAEAMAGAGVVGISVSAPIVMGEGAYKWPADSIETTHKYLQETVAKYKSEKGIDWKRLYVGGFSQGALHSLLLVAEHPDVYLGALAVSPGGSLKFPAKVAVSETPRPLHLVSGTGEHPTNRAMVKTATALWQAAKWPVRTQEHGGGHHFPEGWEETFPAAMKWLVAGGK